MAEESLLVIFGPEFSGMQVSDLVSWGLKRGNVRFAFLGGCSNARGAADMGLLPGRLPGYVPVTEPGAFSEYEGLPATSGKTLPEIFDAVSKDELGALLVVGANPVAKLGVKPEALKKTFVLALDIFLTETAALADVVLPASTLYEKSGTVTNTFGDVQLVKKAADRAGVKTEFEILVRLAGAMGVDVKTLVPFGQQGVTADLGQSRGVQAGEADRHAVWLQANNLEPRLSPFDPLAVLDEITRLVSGYAPSSEEANLDRMNLLGGNDVPSELGFAPTASLIGRGQIAPARDGLFTSGALGQHSPALKKLGQHQAATLVQIQAK